jgi:carbon monoxide dehydrogenase subunit G
MELTGTQEIRLGQEEVWMALNDPSILQQCIPGCESFEPAGDAQYQTVMAATVGPVKAKFKGKLSLSDIRPPSGYALSFEGSGGAAGFGKGSAQVSLAPVPGGTQLSYSVKAQVGGKLAQVGSRLIDGVASKMADEFFTRFKRAVEPEAAALEPASAEAGPAAPSHPGSQAAPAFVKPWMLIAAGVIVVAYWLAFR